MQSKDIDLLPHPILLPNAIKNNLSQRDLNQALVSAYSQKSRAPKLFGLIKLYEPDFWANIFSSIDRILHGRRESPTYRAVTGRADSMDLLISLAESEAISPNNARDIAEGWLKIDALDQLALSQLPTQSVLELNKKGLGFWPVEAGRQIKDVDLRKLGIALTKKQQELVYSIADATRDIGGLWFQDERLTVGVSPLPNTDYLPNATEVLSAFESFYNQEGFFPHSRNWFCTATCMNFSLNEAYNNFFYPADISKLLFSFLVLESPYYSEVLKAQSHQGNFTQTTDSGGHLTKKDDVIKLTNSYRERVYEQAGDRYLLIRKANSSLEIIKGKVLFRNNYREVIGQYDWEALMSEFCQSRDVSKKEYEKPLTSWLVLYSDRREGVSVGMCLDSPDNRYWELAGGSLVIDSLSQLERSIQTTFKQLPVMDDFSWPKIFPDNYAGQIAESTRL